MIKIPLLMRRYYFSFGLIVILLAAGIIRFYQLGQVPAGMTWDEAAIGYNGYAIWNTRRDEWLEFMPISFRSFGDFKAPLAIYINAPFTAAFGLNLWAVRLPFALASLLAIAGMALLTQFLFSHFHHNRTRMLLNPKVAGLIAALVMTFSPWHTHFSRAGFESGLALTALIWGVYFYLKSFFVARARWKVWLDLVLAVGLLVSTLYLYHSAKVTAVLIFLVLSIVLIKMKKPSRKELLVSWILFIILLIPLLRDAVFGEGLARAGVTIFSQGDGVLVVAIVFLKNILAHASPSFWLLAAADTLRHTSAKFGVLLPSSFMLLISGWYLLIARKNLTKPVWTQRRWLAILATSWVLLGLLPAIIGTGVPHPNRALLALPGVVLWLVLCVEVVCFYLTTVRSISARVLHALITVIAVVHLSFFMVNMHYYYNVYPAVASSDWQEGYLEMFQVAKEYESGANGRPEVQNIVITSEYGQPYIYALFSKGTNPIDYHRGALTKYTFPDRVNVGDLSRENALVVATPQAEFLQPEKADQVIYGTDGSIRFMMFYTGKLEP